MAIAFKEWAVVCEALGTGRQSVILRKGGIAEGRGGFEFEHDEFYLFPTWFHGQVDKIRDQGAALPSLPPEKLTVSFAASIEWSGRVSDKETAHRLSELHILDESVIEERFEYDTGDEGKAGTLGGQGIHVAFVRVYRLEPAVSMPMEKKFGGCRSWVELPETDFGTMVSVLSDEEHSRRRELFSHLAGVTL
jgi:hypothetical protein